MAKIKEWNKCENCVHNSVCEFRTGKEKCVEQMNDKLDSLEYMTNLFIFSFECKEFVKRESIRNAFEKYYV